MPPRSGAGGFPISVSGIRGHRMGDAGKKKAARRTNEWHVRHCLLPSISCGSVQRVSFRRRQRQSNATQTEKERLVAIVAPYQSGKLPDVIGNTAPDAFALILLTSMIVAVAF